MERDAMDNAKAERTGRENSTMSKERRAGARWVRWAALAAALVGAGQAGGTNLGEQEMVCPICQGAFSAPTVASYSSGGGTNEGRPISLGEDIQKYRLARCPKCGYSAFATGFKGKSDVPSAEQIEAVRKALAGADKAESTVALAERCYLARKSAPGQMLTLYMLGAWLSDDDRDMTTATAYRAKALAAAEAVARGPRAPTKRGWWWARYLQGTLLMRQGKLEQAVGVYDVLLADMSACLSPASGPATPESAPEEQRQGWGMLDSGDSLSDLQKYVAQRRAMANQGRLGEAKGRAAAIGGTVADKLGFLHVHGTGTEPASEKLVLQLLTDEDATLRQAAAEALRSSSQPGPDVLPALRRALDPESEVQCAVVEALGHLGPAAAPAVEDLLKLSSDRLSFEVLRALASIGPGAAPAVPALVRELKKPNGSGGDAIQALGRIGPAAAPALPMLREAMKDPLLASQAARSLPAVDPGGAESIRVLVAAMDKGETAQEETVYALTLMGKAAAQALRELKPSDRWSRQRQLQALGGMGADAAPAIDMLADNLRDLGATTPESDSDTEGDLFDWPPYPEATALRTIGPRTALPAAAKLLESENDEAKKAGAGILGAWGSHAKPALPRLKELLKAKSIKVAVAAAAAVASIDGAWAAGAGAGELAALADRAAKTKDKMALLHAAFVQAALGQEAGLATLLKALGDSETGAETSERVDSEWIGRLLAQLGPRAKPGVGELIRILETLSTPAHTSRHDPSSGKAVIDVLAAIGPGAERAVPCLGRILLHSDFGSEAPSSAAAALGRIGPAAAPAVPLLVRSIEDHYDENLRAEVAEALGLIGPTAKEALPTLVWATGYDQPPLVQLRAAQALVRLDAPGAKWLARLAAFMDDPDPAIRRQAVRALQELGPAARPAAKALEKARKDRHEAVADEAAWTLEIIGN